MSVWQFAAALNGYVKAHTSSGEKLTDAEADDLFAWISRDDRPRRLRTQTYWLDGDRLIAAGVVTFEVDR